MQNTIARFLFILLITGVLFTGCAKEDESAETDENLGSLEESVLNGGTQDEDSTSDDDDDENDDDDDEKGIDDDGDDDNAASSNGASVPPLDTSTSTTTSAAASYVDGTYEADGSYSSPGGKDTIGVTLVVKNNMVTSVTVTTKAADETSKLFIDQFAQDVVAKVVGKSLSELGSLGAVNGSSLTPMGFNSAVKTIQGLAKK